MARIKDSSVRDVVAAADMVEVVSGRTQLRRASGSRFTGRCPFHEEKTPSFSVNPVEKLYYCFGCGKGGDVISFVRETESLDFVGAVEWLAERFRVPIEFEEASPRVEAERRRRERLYAVLEQTTAYFERLLWDGDAGAPVREYLAEPRARRGDREGVPARARARARVSPRRRARSGFTLDELQAARASRPTRGGDYFPQRLMFPLCGRARARRRLPGAQARARTIRCAGKYVNSPEGDLFHKGSILYGLHLAKTAIAKQDSRGGRRGQHGRHRAAAGRVRARRRVDGDGADRAPAARARAADEEALPLLRRGRRRARTRRCAGWSSRPRRASTSRSSRFRAARIRPMRPTGSRSGSARPRATSLYRVRLEIERSADRQEGFVRAREVLAKAEDSPERQEALRLLADRLDLPRETLAGPRAGARAERAGGGGRARACSMRATGSSATCSPPASRTRRSSAGSPSSTPEHFDSERQPALPRRARRAAGTIPS